LAALPKVHHCQTYPYSRASWRPWALTPFIMLLRRIPKHRLPLIKPSNKKGDVYKRVCLPVQHHPSITNKSKFQNFGLFSKVFVSKSSSIPSPIYTTSLKNHVATRADNAVLSKLPHGPIYRGTLLRLHKLWLQIQVSACKSIFKHQYYRFEQPVPTNWPAAQHNFMIRNLELRLPKDAA
jgi:hypothetical protein